MRIEHVHEWIGIKLFNIPHASAGPFASHQHCRANHRRNARGVADGLVAGFGISILMIADIIDIQRLFLTILAKPSGDAADVGFALGRRSQRGRLRQHGFQELQRNDFLAFIQHRVNPRHADRLKHV